MKLTFHPLSLEVQREATDPKVRGGTWGRADTALFGKIAKALQAQGLDVIRRRLAADGHLMGDNTACYIRDRKWKFALIDEQWAVRDIAEAFNKGEPVRLRREPWAVVDPKVGGRPGVGRQS